MKLEDAQRIAQRKADLTGDSTLVYESLLKPGEYGTAYTLPPWGKRIGDRYYPIDTAFDQTRAYDSDIERYEG